MLDVGWSELLVIGALALIVVGPRDLPHLLRQVGRWVGQVKRLARDFQRSMEDAARETDIANMKELRDLRKDLGNLDFRQQATKAQSYLKQPVKVEPAAGAKPAQPAVGPGMQADAAGSSAPAVAAAPPQGEPDGPPAVAAPRDPGSPGTGGSERKVAGAEAPGAAPGARVPGE